MASTWRPDSRFKARNSATLRPSRLPTLGSTSASPLTIQTSCSPSFSLTPWASSKNSWWSSKACSMASKTSKPIGVSRIPDCLTSTKPWDRKLSIKVRKLRSDRATSSARVLRPIRSGCWAKVFIMRNRCTNSWPTCGTTFSIKENISRIICLLWSKIDHAKLLRLLS